MDAAEPTTMIRVSDPEEDRKLYLAEAPVTFFTQNRYECREKM